MSTETKKLPSLAAAPAAVRMRRYRKRRRRGIRRLHVELHVTDIDTLIRKGYLDHASRDDRDALGFAINAFVNDALTAEA